MSKRGAAVQLTSDNAEEQDTLQEEVCHKNSKAPSDIHVETFSSGVNSALYLEFFPSPFSGRGIRNSQSRTDTTKNVSEVSDLVRTG